MGSRGRGSSGRDLHRRQFLRRSALLGSVGLAFLWSLRSVPLWPAPSLETATMDPEYLQGKLKVGLALGSGGAAGLAHIPMLEVFDELGIRPHHITGTSIGAVIGALYAAGMPARRIRELAGDLAVRKDDGWQEVLREKIILRWTRLFDPEIGQGGLISGESFLEGLYERIEQVRFEELPLPLSVVATDFWRREPVVFDRGPFRPAVHASMALPGLFAPVHVDDHVLIDGGAVNPIPWDLLAADCDLTVAIDVTGRRSRSDELSSFDAVFNTFEIMQTSIIAAKRAHHAPDIYINAGIVDVRALEFHRLDEILQQAEPARQELERRMRTFLEGI